MIHLFSPWLYRPFLCTFLGNNFTIRHVRWWFRDTVGRTGRNATTRRVCVNAVRSGRALVRAVSPYTGRMCVLFLSRGFCLFFEYQDFSPPYVSEIVVRYGPAVLIAGSVLNRSWFFFSDNRIDQSYINHQRFYILRLEICSRPTLLSRSTKIYKKKKKRSSWYAGISNGLQLLKSCSTFRDARTTAMSP